MSDGETFTMILAWPGVFLLLCLGLLALAYRVSGLLLYARRQPLARTPADYGLAYEEVAFQSPDGLTLKGWWVPAYGDVSSEAGNRAVVLLHPMFGNRHGCSVQGRGWPRLLRVEVDLLKTARDFHQAGYGALVFDFRSHGQSQRGLCAGGLAEDQDVAAAVDYVFGRLAEAGPPQVGVVGFGLGAAAAIVALGRDKSGTKTLHIFNGDTEGGVGVISVPPPNVKLLRFLVAVEPASLGSLVRNGLGRMWPPLNWVLFPLVNRLCQWRGGYPLQKAALLKFAREIRIPVMYVQAGPDLSAGNSEVQSLCEVTPGPRHMWRIEGTLGRLETCAYVGDHPERMLAFAAEHTGRPGAGAGDVWPEPQNRQPAAA